MALLQAYVQMLRGIAKHMDNMLLRHATYLPWVWLGLRRMRVGSGEMFMSQSVSIDQSAS